MTNNKFVQKLTSFTIELILKDARASEIRIPNIFVWTEEKGTDQKRWKVEVFHKNIKSNTGLAKSPAKKVQTQSNHIFMSLLVTAKLERLSVKKGLTTFGLKTELYIKAQKEALRA
jgi:hypothetical protein